MAGLDIAQQRLRNQHISRPTLETPNQVVAWLGAVQAQDYAGAKWAVAQRTTGLTDAALDQAFNEGAILRTHVLRPTWHFVTPADIRWLLRLTAPRVHAANATMYRQLELDRAVFRKSNGALAKALRGGRQLTRREIAAALERAGILAANLRLGYLLMRAELDGLVCSGALRGKQHTYALLEERAPQARPLDHDEALAELARRYFTSHGPATLKDFSGWSGLTVAEARRGLEAVTPRLNHEVVDGQTYWFAASGPARRTRAPIAHLLSVYDEYIMGHKDRSAIFDASRYAEAGTRGELLFNRNYVIVMDGQVVGTWQRNLKKGAVSLEAQPFTALSQAETRALAAAADRYGAFLERPIAWKT